jgi:hypothetical protein
MKKKRLTIHSNDFLKDYFTKWSNEAGMSESELGEKILFNFAIKNPKPHIKLIC